MLPPVACCFKCWFFFRAWFLLNPHLVFHCHPVESIPLPKPNLTMLNWTWERKTSWGRVNPSFMCNPANRLSEEATQWQDATSFDYRESLSFTASGLFGQNRLSYWKKKRERLHEEVEVEHSLLLMAALMDERGPWLQRGQREKENMSHIISPRPSPQERSAFFQNQCRDVFLYWLNETHLFLLDSRFKTAFWSKASRSYEPFTTFPLFSWRFSAGQELEATDSILRTNEKHQNAHSSQI